MDRYRIVSSLGAGAAGEALLVIEKSTNKEYVLKRVFTTGMDRAEKERVAREAKTLQMLNHPNIVHFVESFFDRAEVSGAKRRGSTPGEEYFCIVMERCVCSLEDLINKCHEIPEGKGGFPQSLLVEWMTELLAALSFLQQKGIVHRDIKSSNVFVTKKNHLKIGDFGVAKHQAPNDTSSSSSLMGDSASSVVGTAFYMPPEVCDGAPTDHKGDVWSLGILFFELCTLHPPFTGGNILAIVNEISTKSVPHLPANFDARFNRIIRWMLKKEIAQRPTAQDVLDKYVFLPPSHPSHPQHDPDKGRLIQEKHGPPLVLNAGGEQPKSKSALPQAPTAATQQQQHPTSVPIPSVSTAVAQQQKAAKSINSNSNNFASPGRIDGNKPQTNTSVPFAVKEEAHSEPHVNTDINYGPRPSAVIAEDDDDEDEDDLLLNQQGGGTREKLSAPPEAFLDDENDFSDVDKKLTFGKNSSASSPLEPHHSTNNSSLPSTTIVRVPKPDATLVASTDSTTTTSCQRKNEPQIPIKERFFELLALPEAKMNLTGADLDEIVCAIAEFRLKNKV